MSDGQALLAAIRVAPGDDALRLVYADWLEDAGQAERAEFVRSHVELADTDQGDEKRSALLARLHRLHAAHGADWAEFDPSSRSGWVGWRWGRGLVESVTVREPGELAALREEHPLREAVLELEHFSQGWGPELVRERLLDGLSSVAFRKTGGWQGETVPDAFDGVSYPGLRRLRIEGVLMTQEEWQVVLTACPGLVRFEVAGRAWPPPPGHLATWSPALEEIKLDEAVYNWDEEDGHNLCSGPLPERLRELRLHQVGLIGFPDRLPLFTPRFRPRLLALTNGSNLLADFLAAPPWENLESLSLESASLSGERARRLADSGHLVGLKELSLAGCDLTLEDLALLLRAPGLSGLLRLDLSGNWRLAGPVELLTATPLTELTSLNLGDCSESDLAALPRCPFASRLRRLSLSANEPDPALEALTRFPQASLNSVSIFTPGVPSREAIAAVAECPRLPNLTHLALENPETGLFSLPLDWVAGTGVVWPVEPAGRDNGREAPGTFFAEE